MLVSSRPARIRAALRGIAVVFLAIVASGCSMCRKHEVRKIPRIGTVDLSQPRELFKVSLPAHVVEPPDELEIATKPPGLIDAHSVNAVVRADGFIDLGFAGDVYVSGLTLGEVEQKIALHLASRSTQTESRAPIEVSVRLTNGSASKVFYVLGAVRSEGRFPSTGNETVLDAILQAGLKSNSVPDKAFIARPHPNCGPDQILRVEWERIKAGDITTNYQVMPGDRIVVPGTKPSGLLQSLLGG